MKTSELKAKAARYMKIVEWSGVCDRQVTLWGRPPVCRFEGSPPPSTHLHPEQVSNSHFEGIRAETLICLRMGFPNSLRSQRHRNSQHNNHCTSITRCWQAGGLPHRVTFLSCTQWSDEDGRFVGSAPPLIGPCCHGKDEAKVYAQLCRGVEEWIEILETDGQELPEPLAAKQFSGKFVLRVEPALHRRLAASKEAINKNPRVPFAVSVG